MIIFHLSYRRKEQNRSYLNCLPSAPVPFKFIILDTQVRGVLTHMHVIFTHQGTSLTFCPVLAPRSKSFRH
jgi:hypothetical protein